MNKPAPRNIPVERLELNSNLQSAEVSGDEKKNGGFLRIGKGKPKDENAKDAPVLEASYLTADSDGRNAFQIRLTNKQNSPQQYSFTIRWRVLAAPKSPAAAPAKLVPAKK